MTDGAASEGAEMDGQVAVDVITSIVNTLALVIGGLWVAWTFHKLQRVRAAEMEVQRTLADTQKTTAETMDLRYRHLSQQPNLEVTFSEVVEHHVPETDHVYLSVAVDLLNSGARNLQVNFNESTMTLARFDLADSRLRRVSNVYRTGPGYLREQGNRIADIPYRILRAGQHRRMVSLFPASGPGIYLLEFRALYSKLPFEGEVADDEGDYLIIDAVEQRLVPVGLDRSTVLIDEAGPQLGAPGG